VNRSIVLSVLERVFVVWRPTASIVQNSGSGKKEHIFLLDVKKSVSRVRNAIRRHKGSSVVYSALEGPCQGSLRQIDYGIDVGNWRNLTRRIQSPRACQTLPRGCSWAVFMMPDSGTLERTNSYVSAYLFSRSTLSPTEQCSHVVILESCCVSFALSDVARRCLASNVVIHEYYLRV